MDDRTVIVSLPGGLWLHGERHQEVQLRRLSGADEAFLYETASSLKQAPWTTALLARCVVRLGSLTPVPVEAVRALTVGDREALLLHLRRLMLGDRIPCVLTCPSCGELMDLDVVASDLLVGSYPEHPARHEMTIAESGTTYRVDFRLPTGGDQEAVAEVADGNPNAAAQQLLLRCVEDVRHDDGVEVSAEGWPASLSEQLPIRMAELDALAEIVLNMSCPACRQHFSALFDSAAYLRREMEQRVRDLYREVHLLALYYHWSEREIMSMTSTKRRRYLSLLTESLSEA